jgi:acyl-CoA synthetase (AMP-forming)/AMP-acid ligase II
LLNTLALPAHQIGAIVVSGEHVVERYLSGTAPNKIVTNDGKVWHATGDAGYLDSKGELYLVGRIEQQSMLVKDRYPLMVEARAMTYNNIKACAYVEVDNKAVLVVTIKDSKWRAGQ